MLLYNVKNLEFYKGEPVLKSSDLVAWKRSRNIYNFSSLPPLAIISIKKNIFSKAIMPFTRRIKGINGNHYNYKSKILFCSEFGSGSPSLLMLLEELFALGVKKFIFIGVAGLLNDSVKEHNAYIISKVYSTSGSSYFYCNEEKISCFDHQWFETINSICNLDEKNAWTTDCPFRETRELIKYFNSKSCSLVDMETAALYAFSQYYSVPAISILVGADRLNELIWEAPKNMDMILKLQQNLVSKLIKL
jgi:purine-nucleoside phosphorylase